MALAAAAGALTAAGASARTYEAMQVKADRSFSFQEWAQAGALYGQMLHERPQTPGIYGKAIVANMLAGDAASASVRLMKQALDNHVPFDSVFARVRSVSFSLGKTHLYERFLLQMRQGYPWMTRTVNAYLLKYYTFRRNGAKMVQMADVMLAGAPDNLGFLYARADGLMAQGLYDEALRGYERILQVDPADLHSLLTLGYWYMLQVVPQPTDVAPAPARGAQEGPRAATAQARALARDKAVAYLERARAVRDTPHIQAALEQLYKIS